MLKGDEVLASSPLSEVDKPYFTGRLSLLDLNTGPFDTITTLQASPIGVDDTDRWCNATAPLAKSHPSSWAPYTSSTDTPAA